MKCLLVIPARYASTRLPRKLLLNATGKPLICHVVEMAVAVVRLAPQLFTEVIVATDHAEIARVVNEYAAAQHFPARAQMTRADHQSGTDRVAEVAATTDADLIINLQGDEPELSPTAILALAELMTKQPQISMATLAYKISPAAAANPHIVKVVTAANGRALYFSRAAIPYDREGDSSGGVSTAAITYYGHVGIYAYRRATLQQIVNLPPASLEQCEKLEQLRALAHGIDIYVQNLPTAPRKGIDTPEDYAEFVARRLLSCNEL